MTYGQQSQSTSIFAAQSLLDLPPELLAHIFSFVYPPWHLSDVDKDGPSVLSKTWYMMRNHNYKAELFEMPGIPVPWARREVTLDIGPFLICKKLFAIALAAYRSSFTGHAFVSCAESVDRLAPAYMKGMGSRGVGVKHLHVSLSWLGRGFHELMKDRICGIVGGEEAEPGGYFDLCRIYCWKYYVVDFPSQLRSLPTNWDDAPVTDTSASLRRLLESDEFDACLMSETVDSIQKSFGLDSMGRLMNCLDEMIWCQMFDFGMNWDGVFVSHSLCFP